MTRHAVRTLGDVYDHPVGRDVLDKIALQIGVSPSFIVNPLTRRIPLTVLDRVAGRAAPGLVEALTDLLEMNPDRLDDADTHTEGQSEPPWWQGAVFYQIYPRSFADSNGDGIGDLRGIISKLDYLQTLGVDCLWLSPIFDSPNDDMGYDVRDYRAVMDLMGSMEDLDELIEQVHARDMRIILDLVVNHSSAEHEWFQEALRDPDGDKAAYYFLREGSPDAPPNNWVSFFSGSAWRWFDDIKRWGMHLFAPSQMDLNWDNPAVRREVADIVQFWLARGIDGFRMDVINYISKTAGLPNGVPAVGELVGFTGIERYFIGPHLHEYLRELRSAGFTRPDGSHALMVGETPGIGIEVGRLLTNRQRREMDLIFNFDVLEPPGKIRWDDYRYPPAYFLDFYLRYLRRLGPDDQMAIFAENHDNPRIVSKITLDPRWRGAAAKLIATISLTLPGTPFIFQGQELGAVNQDFTSLDQLRDVESLNYFRELIDGGATRDEAWDRILAGSRDHARVPMRWTDEGGFTTGQPWITGTDMEAGWSAAEQLDDEHSVLNFYRYLISVRQYFAHDDFTLLTRSGHYAAWTRGHYLVEVNLSERTIRRPLSVSRMPGRTVMTSLGSTVRSERPRPDELPPYGVLIRLLD